ncbi:unnamed protein product [Allacma fusca]|uniref:CCHC-type domain-containing protein n=1 Tax=Allacma fusca TaxID=39272 RepID=A0A8J2LG78_9HEXA|nr:unnamed protein product [Allacma fusca]
MRYTRAGKSTHQRVAQDSTPWDELKASEAEQKQRFQKNKNFSKNSNGDKSFKGKGGRNNNFQQGGKGEESANFVQLGERLKPGEDPKSRNVQGYGKSKQVKIYGQFWVPVEDATRLKALSSKLKAEGLSRNQIWDALLNERRKAEKVARRARDKICFNCRQFGHVLMDCPNSKGTNPEGDGLTLDSEICFKCGSTEHVSRDCKKSADKFDFAKCFVCSKTGHIARQCPENKRGIYPKGGCCNICKESTHLAKDCPTLYPDQPGEVETVTGRVDDPFTSLEYEGGSIESESNTPAVDETVETVEKPKKGRTW